MSDEIKEILNIIECWKNGDYVLAYSFNYDRASKQNDKLLDYITNLQQENERLNQDIIYYQRYGADMLHKNNELEQRIEKAVEYIHKNYFEVVYKTKGTMENDLLNILNGRSDE